MGARRLAVLLTLVVLACGLALAANVKLYLKDGSYHVVREYQVLEDRVRFYSVERRDWEEIPLNLIDLERTKAEARESQAVLEREARIFDAEDQAIRRQREEIERVPLNPGVYLVDGGQLRPLKQAEPKAVTNKKRTVIKVLTPLPVIAEEVVVELDGEHSAQVLDDPLPQFYFRLSSPERLAIVRLGSARKARVVQRWKVDYQADKTYEYQQEVPIFRQDVADGLFRIWPQQPLEPGEYAVIEYTAGQRNVQAWDFAIRGAGKRK